MLGVLLITSDNLHTFCVLIGICSMCGKKVLDTKNYKQTSVWLYWLIIL